MGLNISFRFRRKDARKIGEDYGRPVYRECDIYQCSTSFCGRHTFDCIRQWVGNDDYGIYIPLDDENFKSFCNMIGKELENQKVIIDEESVFEALDDKEMNPFSLMDLYCFVLKNKIAADKLGWYFEIECDW